MSKHDSETNPAGTPAEELIEAARQDARRRHPAGRKFIRSGLLAVGILAAVPTMAGVAQAATPSSTTSDVAHSRLIHPDTDPARSPGLTCPTGWVALPTECVAPAPAPSWESQWLLPLLGVGALVAML